MRNNTPPWLPTGTSGQEGLELGFFPGFPMGHTHSPQNRPKDSFYHAHILTHMHAHTCAHTCSHLHTCMHTCEHMHTHPHMHVYKDAHTCVQTCTHMYTHVLTFARTHRFMSPMCHKQK